jgi:hypothetical protein
VEIEIVVAPAWRERSLGKNESHLPEEKYPPLDFNLAMTSILSMESPPFRPRGSGSSASAISASAPVFQIAQSPLPSTAGGTPSHHHPLKYAGRSSPTLGEGVYSNAVRSYSFQTPNGYVSSNQKYYRRYYIMFHSHFYIISHLIH